MSYRLKREGASSNIAENSLINLWLSNNDTFITWEDSREVNSSALTQPWAVYFWIRNRAKSRNIRSTNLPHLFEPSYSLIIGPRMLLYGPSAVTLGQYSLVWPLRSVGKKSVFKAFGWHLILRDFVSKASYLAKLKQN